MLPVKKCGLIEPALDFDVRLEVSRSFHTRYKMSPTCHNHRYLQPPGRAMGLLKKKASCLNRSQLLPYLEKGEWVNIILHSNR
jgi:hypothetical protein